MTDHALPSQLTHEQLRARAHRYREMAQGTGDGIAYAGLLRLADRFDAMADTRQEQSQPD
jgi:hypothetical protein